MSTERTSKQFDLELEALRTRVMKMGGLVEEQISRAVQAMQEGDFALADEVIAREHEVNGLEVGIDEDCNRIIALRQPEAGDLRFVLVTLKTITDLERIGDEAEKIARLAKAIHQGASEHTARMVNLRPAASMAQGMLGRALDSFVRLDAGSAALVLKEDRELDRAFYGIMRQIVVFTLEERNALVSAIDIIFAAKALERIGDHAKNIAEYVIFLVKGKDVRHISVEQVERTIFSD